MALKNNGVLPKPPREYLKEIYKERFDLSTDEIVIDTPFDHLRLGDEKWLEYWDDFLNEYGRNGIFIWINSMGERNPSINEILKKLQRGFERLKSIDEKKHSEIVTTDFLNLLLYYLSIQSFVELVPETKEKVTCLIRKEFTGEAKVEDMWNALKALQEMDEERDGIKGIDIDNSSDSVMLEIIEFMSIWKECFSKEIEVNMADDFQAKVAFQCVEYADDWSYLTLDRIFSVMSYFRNGKDDSRTREIADTLIIHTEDKEICYKALKSNLINNRTASYAVTKIFKEEKRLDVLPMLIMKIHGEW